MADGARDRALYDSWHYVEALKYKPGVLRNGALFKEWELPEPYQIDPVNQPEQEKPANS